jgi:hypothetical protein
MIQQELLEDISLVTLLMPAVCRRSSTYSGSQPAENRQSQYETEKQLTDG